MPKDPLSDTQLQNLANKIRKAGGVSGRTASFNEGKIPSLVNVYIARMNNKIEPEEAADLNPNYKPDKMHSAKDKTRTSGEKTRTQSRMFESMIKATPRYNKFLEEKGDSN